MILTGRGPSSKAAALLLLSLFMAVPAQAWREMDAAVDRVVDGDTFMTADGSRVRLLNVDAPEPGAPMAEAAEEWLGERLGSTARMTVCDERDRYGRLLAFVRDGEEVVNLELLWEGLATPFLLAPCGERLAMESLVSAGRALAAGRGLYADARFRTVPAELAAGILGTEGAVIGRVLSVHRSPKALFLEFGPDWKTDFTAVLFKDAMENFASVGLDPLIWVGWKVAVIGRVTEYNGPQVVVRYPDQILPLEPPGTGE